MMPEKKVKIRLKMDKFQILIWLFGLGSFRYQLVIIHIACVHNAYWHKQTVQLIYIHCMHLQHHNHPTRSSFLQILPIFTTNSRRCVVWLALVQSTGKKLIDSKISSRSRSSLPWQWAQHRISQGSVLQFHARKHPWTWIVKTLSKNKCLTWEYGTWFIP